MFRAVTLALAALALIFPAFTGMGTVVRAQGNCPDCDLPPGCRGNGNQNGNGNGNKNRNCQRLEITIESDIDFGRMVLLGKGEGRVMLDLTTGQKTLIGAIDDLGGIPVTGRATITGAPFEAIVIDLPHEIAMRNSGARTNGGDALIRDFVNDLPGFPVLDANGQLAFNFSGTLVIEADTNTSGDLRGRVPISVQYP